MTANTGSVEAISDLFSKEGETMLYRYITANDVGKTGGHQYGFYIPQRAWNCLFDTKGIKGENKERIVEVKWDYNATTQCCFKYYGRGTRNEYRITRFGDGFPYLKDEFVGSLLILIKTNTIDLFYGFVLSSDEEIDCFFETFNLSPTSSDCVVSHISTDASWHTEEWFMSLFFKYNPDFPSSKSMAFWAEKYELIINNCTREKTRRQPDEVLLKWIDEEYRLFQALEEKVYKPIYSQPFTSANELISFANHILNRRKARAGKSLEHHLSRIFRCNKLQFDAQVYTEGKRKPDFIFPRKEDYHNPMFPDEKLVLLAAKTTCKDRWRQILGESERIKTKHLFTLQKGISINQLEEMSEENVILVVPKSNISSFDSSFRDKIWTLSVFIKYVKEMQRESRIAQI